MQLRRKSLLGLSLVAVTALPCLLVAPTAQAASSVSITTVMSSTVQVKPKAHHRPVGAILSIIYICPEGSDLDRTFLTKVDWAKNSTRVGGFRLLSREWWPRGMVTRWRLTSDTNGRIRQSIACRERVSAGTSEHISPFAVTLRLWGPVSDTAHLSTQTVFGVWRGQKQVLHDAIRLRAAKNTLTAWAGIEGFDGDAFYGDAIVTRSYQAGRYAEAKFSTRIRTPGRNCFSCVDP